MSDTDNRILLFIQVKARNYWWMKNTNAIFLEDINGQDETDSTFPSLNVPQKWNQVRNKKSDLFIFTGVMVTKLRKISLAKICFHLVSFQTYVDLWVHCMYRWVIILHYKVLLWATRGRGRSTVTKSAPYVSKW